MGVDGLTNPYRHFDMCMKSYVQNCETVRTAMVNAAKINANLMSLGIIYYQPMFSMGIDKTTDVVKKSMATLKFPEELEDRVKVNKMVRDIMRGFKEAS